MNERKLSKLKAAGWKAGNIEDFLGLTKEETILIEIKVALASSIRSRRSLQGLTQAQLATRLQSSQSRVAKIEAADSSVSVDLLLRSLLALGATQKDLAEILTAAA